MNLCDDFRIKPVIAIRDMWKDGEKTRALFGDIVDNIVYDSKGCIFCYDMVTGEKRDMAFGGFEIGRGCLKNLFVKVNFFQKNQFFFDHFTFKIAISRMSLKINY